MRWDETKGARKVGVGGAGLFLPNPGGGAR